MDFEFDVLDYGLSIEELIPDFEFPDSEDFQEFLEWVDFIEENGCRHY